MTATETDTNDVRALAVQGAASVPVEQVNALATRIVNNKGLFPDEMTPLQAKQIAMIAVAYGLDPLGGEVTVYEGKPLVTLDGRIRVSADHPEFDGIEFTRTATEEERRAFRVAENEDMWVACVWRKGVRFPSVGYGRANGSYERNYIAKHGRGPEMARKRAIVNAVRLLFPMPRPRLPGMERELEKLPHSVENAIAESGQVIEGAVRSLPTNDQLAAIHLAAKDVGYTDEGYRARLEEMFGVRSAQELNPAQADAAIAAFRAEATASADAALDAGVAATKESAARRGRRVRDDITLADDDEAPKQTTGPSNLPVSYAEARIVPQDAPGRDSSEVAPADDSQDLAELAAQEIGGRVEEVPRASDKQKEYIERLLSDVSMEWADAVAAAFPDRDRPNWEALNVQDAATVIDLLLSKKRQ